MCFLGFHAARNINAVSLDTDVDGYYTDLCTEPLEVVESVRCLGSAVPHTHQTITWCERCLMVSR